MNNLLYKIKILKKLIYKYNFEYYILNNSTITDEEYDNLVLELKKLVKNTFHLDSILKYKKNSSYTVKHYEPMLSLNKVFDDKEITIFYNNLLKKLNLSQLCFFCDLKIDGIAINLIYKNGILIKASTRGNSLFGEDITNNIKMVNDIPLKLNFSKIQNIKNNLKLIEIRGEIYINKSNFEKINHNYELLKNKKFSNPRNLASGSIRNDNIEIKKYLNFYAYNLYIFENNFITNNNYLKYQINKINLLKKLNFCISKYNRLCNNLKQILSYYKNINKLRNNLNFEIDGIVLKINCLKIQNLLGHNNKYPKWSIAYKFDSLIKISTLKKIKYQINRIGQLIPIAYIEPINISGVIIKKINLYNFNEIIRLKLNLNDIIYIKRSGNVIPKILKKIPELSINKKENINIPIICPFCFNPLLINNIKFNEINIQCLKGIKCIGQLKIFILHFISKNAFNMKFIGNKLIDKLLKKKLLKNTVDIFNLNYSKLKKVNIKTEKTINKILKSIEISKKINLANFIFSLSIPKIGFIISKKLANNIKSIYKIININIIDLQKYNNLGKKVIENIFNYFNNKINIYYIKLLLTKINII